MENISLEAAVALLQQAQPVGRSIQRLPLLAARGKHLAEAVYATTAVPNFNRAAMDGYAVKAASTKNAPVKLKVCGMLGAGDAAHYEGEAVKIMTGAPIPDGFDAVVKQEDTDYGEDWVTINMPVKRYANYSPVGEDIQKGQLLLAKGTKLGFVEIGLLASVGLTHVPVIKPLTVGLISTGSELQQQGQPLSAGQIYDSNSYLLAARLAELGVNVMMAPSVKDDVEEIITSLEMVIQQADVLLTTGGVSVGKKDLLHDVIKQLNAERLFWRLKMRPGTPALATLYKGKIILSLSGNPFAAMTTFELLFRPLMDRYFNCQCYGPKKRQAVLQQDFPKLSKQRRFVRAYYKESQVFLPIGSDASSVLSTMAGCNCFIDIDAGTMALAKGDTVSIILI